DEVAALEQLDGEIAQTVGWAAGPLAKRNSAQGARAADVECDLVVERTRHVERVHQELIHRIGPEVRRHSRLCAATDDRSGEKQTSPHLVHTVPSCIDN